MVGLTSGRSPRVLALVKQEILGDVGSGDVVREGAGSGDRQNEGRIVNVPPGSLGSERLQESEQSIVRLEAPEWRAHRQDFCQRLRDSQGKPRRKPAWRERISHWIGRCQRFAETVLGVGGCRGAAASSCADWDVTLLFES
jgi:hypothetical protein